MTSCSVAYSELLLLVVVMNSSIFIGLYSSFVVGCRPSHPSRDTLDGPPGHRPVTPGHDPSWLTLARPGPASCPGPGPV